MLLRPRQVLNLYSPFTKFVLDFANVVDVYLIFKQTREDANLIMRLVGAGRPSEIEMNTASMTKIITSPVAVPFPDVKVKWTPATADIVSGIALTPAQRYLLYKRTEKMERWCLEHGHYRLNVGYDQRSTLSSDPSIKMDVPNELAMPVLKDPIEHGTMLVVDAALFRTQGESGEEFYLSDYPKYCQVKSDPTIRLDVRPAISEQLTRFLSKYDGWHPYARVSGQYLSLDSDEQRMMLPVSISFRHLQITDSVTPTQVIEEEKIHDLRDQFHTFNFLKDSRVKYSVHKEIAEEYRNSYGSEKAKEYLNKLHYDLRNELIKVSEYSAHTSFEDQLLESFFGYHVGMSLFLNACARNGYTTLAGDVAMNFSTHTHPLPSEWKELNEIFRMLSARIRFDEEALKAYGRFLQEPSSISLDNPNGPQRTPTPLARPPPAWHVDPSGRRHLPLRSVAYLTSK